MRGLSVAAGVAALFARSVYADVDPIVVKGSKFFYKTNGTQFFIQGVAYQREHLPFSFKMRQLTTLQRITAQTQPQPQAPSTLIP